MGTPFITLLQQPSLEGYDSTLPAAAQTSPYIPSVFRDAMSVREAAFAADNEKGGWIPQLEHDADDSRSCHWVMYASVNTTLESEQRNPKNDEILRPRRSVTQSVPIGTLRIVPFPHPPHPIDGGRYVGKVLQPDSGGSNNHDKMEDGDTGRDRDRGDWVVVQKSQPRGSVASGTSSSTNKTDENIQQQAQQQPQYQSTGPWLRVNSLLLERRLSWAMPFRPDRPTDFHDGKEPYLKLERLAILPGFRRGHHIALELWRAATKWLHDNPAIFDPSIKELGMDMMKVGSIHTVPKWDGLVCVHAQERAVDVYERWGFRVDKKMGRWYEEGIPHVGMFQRLKIKYMLPM